MKSYKTVNQSFMLKMAVFWQQKTAIKIGGKAFFSYLCADLITYTCVMKKLSLLSLERYYRCRLTRTPPWPTRGQSCTLMASPPRSVAPIPYSYI